jgi:phosphatidylserine/phosphatidylglycerophosphate/cardiolipin synthase-like enzyme/membrane protein DedA with SNARE-associated domain
MADDSILKQGKNAWRTERASRVKFLIDGAAYYDAFVAAVERAEHRVILVGWDIDSRTHLCRPGAPSETLCEFLNRAVAKKKGLEIYILSWDFSMIYALERQLFPVYHLEWKTHRRVHFRLDSAHPLGASHHQKVVVVDDVVAFAGGLDITTHRWDTRRHAPVDPRRKDANDALYKPFHDIQVAVDGPAAKALGDMLRERWRLATGHALKPVKNVKSDPWPQALVPDIRDVEVGIARTMPAYEGRAEVREVEQLYLDMIASAKQSIYIENQYTTNSVIAEALAKRLEEDGGPEVIIVSPKMCSGWLEVCTMGVLRAGFINRLQDADKHGRLRVYYPRVTEDLEVFVHSKVMVIDNDIARVGSANIANRSMRVDTECDIAMEARGRPEVQEAIAGFRNKLLGEHLGVPAEAVASSAAKMASLIGGVEALRGGHRTLMPMELDCADDVAAEEIVLRAADPEKPINPEEFIDTFLFDQEPALKARLRRKVAMGLALLLALAVAWSFTPLGQWIDPSEISERVKGIQTHPVTPFAVTAIFALASLVMIPLNAMILATGLAFGPMPGALYALSGVLAAAATGYGAGRLLGHDFIGRVTSSRVNQLSRRLARRGVIAIAAARLFPVAPFTLVNLVAGASHIRFRHFLIGTLIGNLPGVILVTVFGPGALRALYEWRPSTATVAALVAVVLAIGVAAFLTLRKREEAKEKRLTSPEPPPPSLPAASSNAAPG